MIFIAELILWYALLWVAAHWGKQYGIITYAVTAAIVANIETTQLISVFGLTVPGGIIPFACLFLSTDIASEQYGPRFSKSVVFFSGIGMMVGALVIALFSQNAGISAAYHEALGSTVRIAFASIAVYYLCGWLDVCIYHFIGKRIPQKWVRNNVGTITSQLVNAVLFILLAYGWIGIAPMLNNWLISLVLALVDTPMVYIITGRDRLLKE